MKGAQVEKLRVWFNLSRVVLVGDRGMLTQARIKELKKHPDLGPEKAWSSRMISKKVLEMPSFAG